MPIFKVTIKGFTVNMIMTLDDNEKTSYVVPPTPSRVRLGSVPKNGFSEFNLTGKSADIRPWVDTLTFEAVLYIKTDMRRITVFINSSNTNVQVTTEGTGGGAIDRLASTATTAYQLDLGTALPGT